MKNLSIFINEKNLLFSLLIVFLSVSGNLFAQQWSGTSNLYGNLYRLGRTGIGLSSTPAARLHVYEAGGGDHHSVLLSEFGSDGGRWTKAWLNRKDSWENWYALYLSSNVVDGIIVAKYNGNVGIGTNNPGTYKLAVEGKIGAREVIVTSSPWADFVFDDNYKLATLKEVESFIKQNKHLPGIPTQEEINEDGANVGEIQAKLLQKIEELTLHLIEQEKRINKLEKALRNKN